VRLRHQDGRAGCLHERCRQRSVIEKPHWFLSVQNRPDKSPGGFFAQKKDPQASWPQVYPKTVHQSTPEKHFPPWEASQAPYLSLPPSAKARSFCCSASSHSKRLRLVSRGSPERMCGNVFSSGKNISPHGQRRKVHSAPFPPPGENSARSLAPLLPTRNASGWFLAGALSGCAETLFPPEKTFPPIRSAGEWGVQTLIGLSIGLYLVSSYYRSSLGNPTRNSGLFQSQYRGLHAALCSSSCRNMLVWLIIVRCVSFGFLLSYAFSSAVFERFSRVLYEPLSCLAHGTHSFPVSIIYNFHANLSTILVHFCPFA